MFVTDTILTTIMCASKSVYSWDVVVTRVGDKLFFDKREGSTIDLLTVNETAPEQVGCGGCGGGSGSGGGVGSGGRGGGLVCRCAVQAWYVQDWRLRLGVRPLADPATLTYVHAFLLRCQKSHPVSLPPPSHPNGDMRTDVEVPMDRDILIIGLLKVSLFRCSPFVINFPTCTPHTHTLSFSLSLSFKHAPRSLRRKTTSMVCSSSAWRQP